MKKSLPLLPLVLIASALALAACGGGGSSSSGGSGEEEAIAEVIEKSATTTGPSKCTELQTQAFNEQEKAVSGKEATEACEEDAKKGETAAEGVNVSDVKVEGEKATAVAEVEGSALNGQGIELELVEEEGKWKMNQFLGFASYDGQALAEALEKEFEKEKGISAALGKCVAEGVAKFSQAEAEAVAFEGEIEGLEKLAKGCQSSE